MPGLDIIHLQAKRYAAGNGIGVEKIREVAGILDGNRVTKGAFVASSHVASQAIPYAKRNSKRLILIDSEGLTRLRVKYGIVVKAIAFLS